MIQILIFITNIILVNAAFLFSFYMRYGLPIPEHNFLPYKDNFAFLTFLYMLAFIFVRIYKKRFACHWDIVKRVFMGMLIGTLFGFMLVYIFRMRWAAFPSSVFAISLPTGFALISICDIIILRLTGRIKTRVIILGSENIDTLLGNKKLTQKININQIEDLLKYEDIDEIILCEKIHTDSQLNLLLFLLQRSNIKVTFTPSLYAEILSGNITTKHSIDFLATFVGRKSEYEEFLIRLVDLATAICIAILTAPIMLATALIIKITSSGPVFYIQERAGKDGQIFKLIKFRTMAVDAESKTGPVLATADDNRVIPLGKFLRQTRIDELPQLLNVLKGDMSMVGPRPERPHFAKIHKSLRGIRMAVKPGLTGLAQIRSSYDIKPQHKTKYDYLYIQRRSALLNIYLIFKTVSVIIMRKGV